MIDAFIQVIVLKVRIWRDKRGKEKQERKRAEAKAAREARREE